MTNLVTFSSCHLTAYSRSFLFENLQQQASQLLLAVATMVFGQPSPQAGLGELKRLLPGCWT